MLTLYFRLIEGTPWHYQHTLVSLAVGRENRLLRSSVHVLARKNHFFLNWGSGFVLVYIMDFPLAFDCLKTRMSFAPIYRSTYLLLVVLLHRPAIYRIIVVSLAQNPSGPFFRAFML